MTSSPIESEPSSIVAVGHSSQSISTPIAQDDVVADKSYIGRTASSFKPFSRKTRKATQISLQQWETPRRQPYHEYVYQLVSAGWDNLGALDNYMSTSAASQELVISVLDISTDFQLKKWDDIYDEVRLKSFLNEKSRDGVKVRLYMVECDGKLAPGLMEAFGGALSLDPRFFLWSIYGNRHVFTPSQRHRSNFVRLGFGVLKTETAMKTDADKFSVMVYIQPDEDGDGYTGSQKSHV